MKLIRLFSLFSGSSGNCTFISGAGTKLLIDCGGSGRQVIDALAEIGVCGSELSGILVTHEHIDHIKGIGIMSRRFDLPVFATDETWAAMESCLGRISGENVKVISAGEGFEIGGMGIVPFSLPHDAADPVGYSFEADGMRAAVATDLGHMTDGVFSSIAGCDTVLLEANHDTEMLWNGSYPYYLKKRIDGKLGHLSNSVAAAACARLAGLGTRHILLGHLSRENNSPQTAFAEVSEAIARCGAKIGRDIYLAVAHRSAVSAAQAV